VQPINFYQNHLDQVSRSFSFCIARLEPELRTQVSLSYLILRVLDSIEDARWDSDQSQRECFEGFDQFMQELPQEPIWKTWLQEIPKTLPAGEQNLLADSRLLFQELHQLPVEVRGKIQTSVLNMSRGMRSFLELRESKNSLRLKSLEEVNGYCFFVAGIVGELLTDLVGLKNQGLGKSPKIYVQAIHFGLFLQKINLLKDQLTDEKEGRYLIPCRNELMASLRQNAKGAVEYLLAIPYEEKGFRLFCGWSLYLGLASIPWIQQSWILKILEKIPRALTTKLLTDIEAIIDDNAALARQFQDLTQALPSAGKSIPKSETSWISYELFCGLYSGRLSFDELCEIGLFSR
jgi:phytoene/squalene synthetase